VASLVVLKPMLHLPEANMGRSRGPTRQLGYRASSRQTSTTEQEDGRPQKRMRLRKELLGSQSGFPGGPSQGGDGSQSGFPGGPSQGGDGSQTRFLGEPSANPDEFRRFVGRLYLRNNLSALTTQQLVSKAQGAGASSVDDLARAGRYGRHRGNISRDMLRSSKRASKMPPLYYAQIQMRDPKSGNNNVVTWMPFLLVHEVLAAFVAIHGYALRDLSDSVEATLRDTCTKLGADPSEFLPLGCHGDGVPNQARKTIVCFSWNILTNASHERILFAALGKDMWFSGIHILYLTLVSIVESRNIATISVQSTLLGALHRVCNHYRRAFPFS